MYFGETRQFTVQLTTGKQPLVWTTGWCAQGEETLKQNLEKIQFEMAVDGQPGVTALKRGHRAHF
jgi:hypothetical protein